MSAQTTVTCHMGVQKKYYQAYSGYFELKCVCVFLKKHPRLQLSVYVKVKFHIASTVNNI